MTNAARIAELERERVNLLATPVTVYDGKAEQASNRLYEIDSELSRLRNEQPRYEWQHDRDCTYVTTDGPAPCACKAGEIAKNPPPLPSPEAQGVQVTDAMVEVAWRVIHKETSCNCRECIRKALIAALAQSDAQPTHRDMAYFGASEAAGYHYPGEDQQPLRDAYCRGAAEYAPKPADAQPVVQSQGGVAWQAAVTRAIEFIADEYRDESLAPEGEWLPKGAREIHALLCEALYASPPASPDGAVREALEAVKRTLAAYQKQGAPHAFVGDISLQKVHALIDDALTTPPTPGLIEAAEWHEEKAKELHTYFYSGDLSALHLRCAKEFRTRAASKGSGK